MLTELLEKFEDVFKPASDEELADRPGRERLAYAGQGKEFPFESEITIKISGLIVEKLYKNKYNGQLMKHVKQYNVDYDRKLVSNAFDQAIAKVVGDIVGDSSVGEKEQTSEIGEWSTIGFAKTFLNKGFREEMVG